MRNSNTAYSVERVCKSFRSRPAFGLNRGYLEHGTRLAMNAHMTTTNAEIHFWTATNASLELIERILGKAHVAWIRTQANAVACCESRAWGAWQANASDSYCAYRSLALHIREGR